MNSEERLKRIKALEKRLDRQYSYFLTIQDPIKRGDYTERMDETADELQRLQEEQEAEEKK